MRNGIIIASATLAFGLLAGCDAAPEGERNESTPGQAVAEMDAAAAAADGSAPADAGEVIVYKSPTCGCCSAWIEHLESEGFDVEGVDIAAYAELSRKKVEHGVPGNLGSCHTARVAGYTIEGHVPGDVVARLLREQPDDIVGLAVAGMPIGSPGMEGPNPEVYDVIAFDAEGNQRVYATVDPR
jgi:hypothetical protein